MKAYIITALRDRVIFSENLGGGYEEVELTGKEFKTLFPHYIDFNPSEEESVLVRVSYKSPYSSFPVLKDAGNQVKEIDFSKITVSQVEKLLKL